MVKTTVRDSQAYRPAAGDTSVNCRQKLDEVRRCTKDRLPAHLGGGGGVETIICWAYSQ